MSDNCTNGVRVQVASFYVEQRSEPERQYYFFAYRVRITNVSEDTVRLVSRHWIITDGDGEVQEVKGLGVVGEQPHLDPGEHFEYTSACPLPTPVGTMHGNYQMVGVRGEEFDAEIAPFTLAVPNMMN